MSCLNNCKQKLVSQLEINKAAAKGSQDDRSEGKDIIIPTLRGWVASPKNKPRHLAADLRLNWNP